MNASRRQTFYYNSNASALGGVLKKPTQQVMTSDASVSLPQAGGTAEKRAHGRYTDSILSFDSAHVSVSGHQDVEADVWRERVTARIDGLNILQVVSADCIVAQMSVAHPGDGSPTTISLTGSQFVNFRVAGSLVEPVFNPAVFVRDPQSPADLDQDEERDEDGLPTFESLLQLAIEQKHRLLPPPKWLGNRMPTDDPRKQIDEKGSALCPIIMEIPVKSPAVTYAQVIHVPDFGNIFLGELLIGRAYFHLTMLRVEMGCMADGVVSACDAFTNGRTIP